MCRERKQIEDRGRTEYVDSNTSREIFAVARSSLLTDIKVCSLLKHIVHRRFLLINTTIAHNTLHTTLCRFQLMRADPKISPLIPVSARRDIVNEVFAEFRSNEERRGDLLVPKDQHSIVVDFSTVLEDRIAFDVSLV